MAKKVIWATIFAGIALILQSTVLSRLSVYIHAVPDIALVILVFTAYVNGTVAGQLTGFCSGILMDCMSAAPLGLNAFIRTILGALSGLMNGSFFLDTLFLPMALCAGATLLKALFLYALHILFSGAVAAYPLTDPTLWVELVLNTLSAPFLFAFLKLFKPLLAERREG